MADTIQLGNRELSREAAERVATGLLAKIKGEKDKKSGMYSGGIGSDCFNKNMEIASQDIQEFLVTRTEFPKTMQTVHTGDRFVLTRNNLVVQSCGRALLEVTLLLTWYFAQKIRLPLHLVCTIHDAILYEVPKARYRELCAIMQMAHIYAWGVLRDDLGIHEYGLSGAFFEGFEVGPFLRKAYDAPTVTPFNPQGHSNHTLVEMWESIEDMVNMFKGGGLRRLSQVRSSGEDPWTVKR